MAQKSTTLNSENLNTEKKPDAIEDLRVRRTRKLIQQAFLELTVEKGFSTITVQDIADRAMVNRSTFYRHYLDKFDLLDKYLDEVYALSAEEELLAEKSQQKLEDVPTGLLGLLKQVQKNVEFYRVMLGPKGDQLVNQRMRDSTARRFQKLLGGDPMEVAANAPPVDLRISYISCAGIGAILWWLDHQQDCSAVQLARWLGQLSSASAGLSLDEYLRRANSVPPDEPAIKPHSGAVTV